MVHPQAVKLRQFLEASGIQDPQVLDAMQNVPRHRFVSQAMAHQAYTNQALPIGHSQSISQPYLVAKMTQYLNLTPTSRVLEIGTGSGYQTAVLSGLAEHVYSIERIKALQWEAKRRLKQCDIYNISTKHGDGWQGWPVHAPFDAIIVTAAAMQIPNTLIAQLKLNGRMVIPVGEEAQQLIIVHRQQHGVTEKSIEPVRFVPLIAGELA